MKEVAERLRSLRESVKLSQVKMAEIVGVKQSSLNRYELNQASPTFETLTRYADYFDVSMDYIFGRTDNPQGKLYEYKPKIQQNNPQMQKFVEMCFDPTSHREYHHHPSLFPRRKTAPYSEVQESGK